MDANTLSPADHQAITDLLVDYCVYLDRMDLDALAALFTEDCEVEYGDHPALRSLGSAALAASLQRMWRWSRTSHHLSNVRLSSEDPDTVEALSYVLAWHERADGSTATIYGQYRDRVVRADKGWRIARRRMLMNGSDAGFSVPITPLPRQEAPPGWTPPDIDR
ncbi:MAG: nuclear transport factor 2 family protein [Halieaceae bacterium]|jgi:3-phenylpropionate/cinnamic acid dioxygenase small subunit|nr:nuclear transport factor 2 family protein [Halieaceae bacterium]